MNALDHPLAKGATLRSTIAFLREEGGNALVERVLLRIAPDVRLRIEAARATDETPFEWITDLLNAADVELGPIDSAWSERAGRYAIASSGKEYYGGLIRKSTPLQFLTQPVSLFRLYYQPGDMEVVERADNHVVLRLVGFDYQHALFCQRQTGGLVSAVELAGGRNARVKHVRCTGRGDAFCEWSLHWTDS